MFFFRHNLHNQCLDDDSDILRWKRVVTRCTVVYSPSNHKLRFPDHPILPLDRATLSVVSGTSDSEYPTRTSDYLRCTHKR